MNHIVVATDYGGASLALCAHAVAFARPNGGRITLLHVDEYAAWPLLKRHPPGLASALELLRSRRERAERWVADQGIAVTSLAVAGSARKVIGQQARELSADLLIIAKRTKRNAENVFIGTTTKRVLRSTPCPVLVAPFDGVEVTLARTRVPRSERLVAPTDLGATSLRALRWLGVLAETMGWRVVVPYVVVPPQLPAAAMRDPKLVFGQDVIDGLRAQVEPALRAAIADLPGGTERWDARVIVDEEAATGVLDVASQTDADLIALPSTGRGRLERLMLGSTAERVVRRAEQRPVLVMPHEFLERL